MLFLQFLTVKVSFSLLIHFHPSTQLSNQLMIYLIPITYLQPQEFIRPVRLIHPEDPPHHPVFVVSIQLYQFPLPFDPLERELLQPLSADFLPFPS